MAKYEGLMRPRFGGCQSRHNQHLARGYLLVEMAARETLDEAGIFRQMLGKTLGEVLQTLK